MVAVIAGLGDPGGAAGDAEGFGTDGIAHGDAPGGDEDAVHAAHHR
jgi:hypothetical protein